MPCANMYPSGAKVLDYHRRLSGKNGDACADSLMNGHWEALFRKVDELLHATHDPHNYRMLI